MSESRPNVLLVVFDTARADAFEPYGAPRGSTPVIADLARRGRAAPNAFAPCNWTLPSHASMFTGLLPGPLGLASASGPGGSKAMISNGILNARRDRVLAEVLRRSGYETAAISANPWIHEINGFATGFERFSSVHGGPRRRPGRDLRSKVASALDALKATADDGAEEAERLLDGWLAARSGRPFFWFVNLMECHSPYLPPRPFNRLGPLDRLRAGREAARHLTIEAMYRFSLGESDIPAAALRRMRRLYADSVRIMDSWMGRVLARLDRAGVLDDTIVVVASDHGENIGENHLISHILSLDDRLIRVPLVTSGPLEIDTGPLVGLSELPALLAAAIGLDDHPWRDAGPEGVAVAQASSELLLPMLDELVKGWAVSEEAVRALARTMTCATDGRFKLVRDETGERVYDTASDASETRPLDAPALAEERDLIARLRRAVDGVASRTAQASEVAPAERSPELSAGETAALEERMRLLGYL